MAASVKSEVTLEERCPLHGFLTSEHCKPRPIFYTQWSVCGQQEVSFKRSGMCHNQSQNCRYSVLALQACGLSSFGWQRFFERHLVIFWYSFDLVGSNVSFFPVSRWHICIWLFAETSPWRLWHIWTPPGISSVKWAVTSSAHIAIRPPHSIPPSSVACVCVCDAGG